jgi:EAL domain-containing protein (putative c-di-GMP-specific phosphodiesterase class I)
VDILKIDRTFIRDIPADEEAAAMVTAVVQLAESLGMTPLAEGIETEEQWHFLAERGCRLGQGYLFSRPLPASELQGALMAGTAGQPAAGSGDTAVA